MNIMEWYYVLLIVIGSVIVFSFTLASVIGGIFYHITFSRRKGDKHFAETEPEEEKHTPAREWLVKQKIEEYTMKSYDHKTLKGYMVRSDSDKLAILIHGYRGRYYSLAIQAQILHEAGYNIFMVNHRASDTSSGHWFTMGPKETRDMLGWINLLIKENRNFQILLCGASMGGHITMMTAGAKDLPSNVKCAAEDCGYASLHNELYKEIGRYHMPKALQNFIFGCAVFVCRFYHNHGIRSNTKDALANCHIPVLFTHGDKDTYVPYENLDINYGNLTTGVYKEKHTFEGAAHCESYKVFTEEYKRILLDFVSRFIK